MSAEFGFADLERYLQMPVPTAYVAYVQKANLGKLRASGFDPKTLCLLNLRLREGDKTGWTKGRFFVAGDGCGNYYFIDNAKTKASDRILLWAHDPLGIENPKKDLATLLKTVEPNGPSRNEVSSGTFCITRAEAVAESLLNPISLAEWKAAAASRAGVRYVGYREGKNPFTGEVVRFDSPGLAIVTFKGKELQWYLQYGYVVGDYIPQLDVLLESLAKALKAKLIVGIEADSPGE